MSDEQQLVPVGISAGALSVAEIIEQGRQIEELMKQVMKEGLDRDYGTIPGTKKPTLLKPGAEKILSKFRLATAYTKEERDLGDGHWLYTITCRLTHIPTGAFVGEGLGCCSTAEGKYKHQEPATIYNTVLKMARKRAMVDAVMTATSASDFFTQDTEDSHSSGGASEGGDRPKGYTETVGKIENVRFSNGYYNFYVDHKRHWTQEAGLGALLDKHRDVEVLAKSTKWEKEGKISYRLISIEPIASDPKLPEDLDYIPDLE